MGGFMRVEDLEDLFTAAETLTSLKPVAGNEILIVTNGGGAGVLAVDDLVQTGGALAKLGPKADRVVPILIAIDPERDTPERLKRYTADFHPRLVALTGTPGQIADVLAAYRVPGVRKTGEQASPAGYTLPERVQQQIAGLARDGGGLRLFSTPVDAVAGADAVYTDVWTSMGQEDETRERTRALKRILPRVRVEAVLARTGHDRCCCPRLPAWFMVWFVIALGLFCRDCYRQVFRWLQPFRPGAIPPRSPERAGPPGSSE